MTSRTIYITENDAQRLRELLRVQLANNPKDRENLRVLEAELQRAILVKPSDVQPDVVTIHSRVVVKCGTNGERMDCTLVFPEEADAENGRISVVAPIGAALLGYRVGDRMTYKAPAGVKKLAIETILFQPEAAGAFITT